MTISGGIKFFNKSFCDISIDEVNLVVSSGGSVKDAIRDRKNTTKWSSLGSNDATTETIEIDFGEIKTIDRLILIKNNLKAFNVQYHNGSSYTDFSSVVTKEGTQASITETANTKTTNYYEFASVSTQYIKITMTTTQTTNDEKYIYQVIATSELGAFTGYPVFNRSFSPIVSRKTTLSGKTRASVFGEMFECSLSFNGYPTALDHALVLRLWENSEEFLIYPCGGNEDQFRFKTKGDRLEDLWLVTITNDWSPNYVENVYCLPLNYSLNLTEVA